MLKHPPVPHKASGYQTHQFVLNLFITKPFHMISYMSHNKSSYCITVFYFKLILFPQLHSADDIFKVKLDLWSRFSNPITSKQPILTWHCCLCLLFIGTLNSVKTGFDMTELTLNSVFAHSTKKMAWMLLNACCASQTSSCFKALAKSSLTNVCSVYSRAFLFPDQQLSPCFDPSLWRPIFLNEMVQTYSMDIRATESQLFVWASSRGTGGCSIACHHSSSAFLLQEETPVKAWV